jgi:hypothetical protein
MATSQKTFDQVKSILGKLDRNIDAVRERRLGDPPSPVGLTAGPGRGMDQLVGGAGARPLGGGLPANYPNMNTLIGAPAAAPVPAAGPQPGQTAAGAPAASKSPYGRAQPIRQQPPQ